MPVFWKGLITCLVTTQQKAGPQSAVYAFMHQRPFPLAHSRCRKARNLQRYAQRAFSSGGLRFANKLGQQVELNFRHLDTSKWNETRSMLNQLSRRSSPSMEREVALYLSSNLIGIGPKQSRNLLQHLGLTRYEIPLDSRNIRWLNDFGFPFHLAATGLQDPHYYAIVLDGIQFLCRKAQVLPCVLDAAIFASYDKGKWGRV